MIYVAVWWRDSKVNIFMVNVKVQVWGSKLKILIVYVKIWWCGLKFEIFEGLQGDSFDLPSTNVLMRDSMFRFFYFLWNCQNEHIDSRTCVSPILGKFERKHMEPCIINLVSFFCRDRSVARGTFLLKKGSKMYY